MNREVSTVMVTMETAVVTAMAEDRMCVSSPIFSAWIMGRLPTGTDAMRHMARVAVVSKDRVCMTKTIAMGVRIMRRAM